MSASKEKEKRKQERILNQEKSKKDESKKKKLKVLGGLVLAAVVILVGLILINSESTKEETKVSTLNGIAQNKNILGDKKSEVTITEYADLQCPFCKQASDEAVPKLINDYIKTNQAKFEFNLLNILGEDSVEAANAAMAAGEQNKMFEFIEEFYNEQGSENTGYVNTEFLEDIAQKISGLDLEKFKEDLNNDYSKEYNDIKLDASKDKVQGTPQFIIRGPEGEVAISNFNNYDEFKEAINTVK